MTASEVKPAHEDNWATINTQRKGPSYTDDCLKK